MARDLPGEILLRAQWPQQAYTVHDSRSHLIVSECKYEHILRMFLDSTKNEAAQG